VVVVVGLHLIGAEKAVLDAYIIFAAIQSIIIHSNLDIPWGVIKYVLVTPQYHHWHHSSERPAIDSNFGAHTTIFDRMFGSYHFPEDHWPAHYGTTKRLPREFFSQLKYPFDVDSYELKPKQVKK
jgi:sterol desaturase/sphingolipid hydroxylase (fatty acid hydroxylase superfamily)